MSWMYKLAENHILICGCGRDIPHNEIGTMIRWYRHFAGSSGKELVCEECFKKLIYNGKDSEFEVIGVMIYHGE